MDKITKIAFDVDGCLIGQRDGIDVPNYYTIHLLCALAGTISAGNHTLEIIVWSGSGIDYAQRWVEKLGIKKHVKRVIGKGSEIVDIAFDDKEVNLGRINIQI